MYEDTKDDTYEIKSKQVDCCNKKIHQKTLIKWVSAVVCCMLLWATVGILIWYFNRDDGKVDQNVVEEDGVEYTTQIINSSNGTMTIIVTEIVSYEYSWYVSGGGEFGVSGKDIVEYFSLSSSDNAVDGDDAYQTEWEGIKWKFKDETNLNLFESNPTDYAPRFGGYCAYAMANGYSAKGSANAWTVYNGQLYLNFDKGVRSSWSNSIDSNIEDGDENWGTGEFDWDNWDADF